MKRAGRGWALGAALLAYIGLPYLVVQVGNLGLLREGKRARREVALTFDDGPDPVSTPAVLAALEGAGMHATFFVMAASAEAHPELIGQMLRAGHQVGVHGARHRHAWMRSPWEAFADPGRAARRVQAVIDRLSAQAGAAGPEGKAGPKVSLHRPPHGAYTLATVLGQRRAGLRGVHWSIEGRDWNARLSVAAVRERLSRLLVPGAVIVLHDAGPGARTTLPLLPHLLGDLKARGYASVTLAQLDGAQPQRWPSLKRRLFGLLDQGFDRLGHIHYAGQRHDNLFRIGAVDFPLADIVLNGGTPVPRGTRAAEFHVNNPLLVDLGPRRAVRQAPTDFAAVARDLEDLPEFRNAEVIFCLSSLAPLLGLLKFENHDLPDADARRLRGWANTLRRAYGSVSQAQRPRLSILSRERFLELYGRPERDTASR